MKFKDVKLEIKEMGESGSFTGLASVYGNVDLGNDVVEPGAFTKTIQDKKGEVPVLWQHNSDMPIGMGKLIDSAEGLIIKGELGIDISEKAREAYGWLRRGVLKGLSIGYDMVRSERKGDVRHLTELKLYEVSVVTFPMNEMASVLAVKGEEYDDFCQRLSDLEALVAQHAAKLAPVVPPAAEQDKDAPEFLHPSLDRIDQILSKGL